MRRSLFGGLLSLGAGSVGWGWRKQKQCRGGLRRRPPRTSRGAAWSRRCPTGERAKEAEAGRNLLLPLLLLLLPLLLRGVLLVLLLVVFVAVVLGVAVAASRLRSVEAVTASLRRRECKEHGQSCGL